jgi:1-pyrroline-5-carboxylate dehydrogenase
MLTTATLPVFENMAYLNFTDPDVKTSMEEAIRKAKEDAGKEYPMFINGNKVYTDQKLMSYNPGNREQVLGVFQKADVKAAQQAMDSALKAFEAWKNVSPAERAQHILQASALMKERRLELNAVMILEVGKNWIEADADTCEAIDFLEFYARQMLEYGQDQPLTPYEPEENHAHYIPLGVGVVIPPWNFPCAILAGMSAAAIVAGNTVILKPASDSPLIGYKVAEIFHDAGLPGGVLNFITGPGSLVGNFLVEHPKTRFISFTGSMDVGKGIYEKAGKVVPGQIWLKRAIIEMGGKDATIVDWEADMEAAVDGVVAGAYGFQGQKCSACSRAIVDEKIYDQFVEKLKARVERIRVGDVADYNNYYAMGPVINDGSFKKCMEYIEIGRKEGRLLTGGTGDDSKGCFVQPTVFTDIKPGSRLDQDEIFGPILAVIKARDYDHALDIANGTIYGLTGAVFSKNKDKLDRAVREFHVGNLYLNRKCTGALVDVHPFGGFNMSGTDSKAGGRDYLLLHLQMKSWTLKKGTV